MLSFVSVSPLAPNAEGRASLTYSRISHFIFQWDFQAFVQRPTAFWGLKRIQNRVKYYLSLFVRKVVRNSDMWSSHLVIRDNSGHSNKTDGLLDTCCASYAVSFLICDLIWVSTLANTIIPIFILGNWGPGTLNALYKVAQSISGRDKPKTCSFSYYVTHMPPCV